MASGAAIVQDQPSPARLQLKKWQPHPWQLNEFAYNTEPQTPSEWFSKMFPEQAKRYGTPFLELVEPLGDCMDKISPIAPNIDFLAAVLGGDTKLGHKVVYVESEMQFYFYDCRERTYKPVSEEKLGNLMRAYLIRCAEELPNNIQKYKLFLDYRSDNTIRSIVHRAKSILATDASFFGAESRHTRLQGPELYERVARAFVEQVLERQAGETLLLTDAYVAFCDYLRKKNMAPVKRKTFKSLVPPVIQDEFNLGIRNDLHEQDGGGWHCGWKGIRALDLEPVEQSQLAVA